MDLIILKVDLSLQDSGPFFVRAVLPNLPNPPGYGPVDGIKIFDKDDQAAKKLR